MPYPFRWLLNHRCGPGVPVPGKSGDRPARRRRPGYRWPVRGRDPVMLRMTREDTLTCRFSQVTRRARRAYAAAGRGPAEQPEAGPQR